MTAPDGDVQRMLAEATVISAAASFMASLPDWMRDVFTIHKAEVARLREAGDDAVADLVALHEPIIDDEGILCADGDGPYPCRLLRARRGGWVPDLPADWTPPDWWAEYDRCGLEANDES